MLREGGLMRGSRLSTGSAAMVVARWSMATDASSHHFSPHGPWVSSIVRLIPMRLFPQWLLVLLSKLLLPRICVAEITDGNINFSYRVTAADLNEAARRDGGRGDGARSVFVKQAHNAPLSLSPFFFV